MTNPAIVISAYNRPAALRRLLSSLLKAAYPQDSQVRLIISIDHGSDAEYASVLELARDCKWPFGPKEVIEQKEHLGLVRHIFFCYGLSKTHNAIICLEDDLVVSSSFYTYVVQALEFYAKNDKIAAFSLYGLWFNGYTQQPFIPLSDDTDVFFLQMPYTQGLACTRSQWEKFSDWLLLERPLPAEKLHDSFFHFGPDEWFPLMAAFVVENDLYVVYPRVSLTSGMGNAGTHFSQSSVFFQTPLQGSKNEYHFPLLNKSNAVYDAFFEILPDRLNRLTDNLHDFKYEYEVDLYATKHEQQLFHKYVLTSRRCGNAIKSFGKEMWPIEMNVVENIPGKEIFLCEVTDLKWGWLSNILTYKSNYDFFNRHRRFSRKLLLVFSLINILQAVKKLLYPR